MPKLKGKMEEFCHQYLIDLNGTQAAIRAKYAKNSAHVEASRLLRKANIQDRIAELRLARAKRTKSSQDEVIHELQKVAYGNIAHFATINDDGMLVLDLSACTADELSLVKEFKAEVASSQGEDGEKQIVVMDQQLKLYDKMKALELLGRHHGMFTEKVEVTGLDGLVEMLRKKREAINNG